MEPLADRILTSLAHADGQTDRELTDVLLGHTANQQGVNATCRRLERRGVIIRKQRADGLTGNFLSDSPDVIQKDPDWAQAAGDSQEQRVAESELIRELGKNLGVTLTKKALVLPDGGRLELDGSSEQPPIICEAWAHIGSAKSAQKNKVMTDAFKLIFASQFLPAGTRKILVVADGEAVQHLQGKAWMAQALKANNVEIYCVRLQPETLEALRAAQKRQFR